MPFPFAAGISGSMKQMQQRIANISSYKKPSVFRKLKGFTAFVTIGVILFAFAPMLSTYAAEQSLYQWNIPAEKVSMIDLSAWFSGYKGSFVLYDLNGDIWNIYDMEQATLRTAPNSTYKIYDALFGLEEGVIARNDSFMAWDGTNHPFEAWNADQDLYGIDILVYLKFHHPEFYFPSAESRHSILPPSTDLNATKSQRLLRHISIGIYRIDIKRDCPVLVLRITHYFRIRNIRIFHLGLECQKVTDL